MYKKARADAKNIATCRNMNIQIYNRGNRRQLFFGRASKPNHRGGHATCTVGSCQGTARPGQSDSRIIQDSQQALWTHRGDAHSACVRRWRPATLRPESTEAPCGGAHGAHCVNANFRGRRSRKQGPSGKSEPPLWTCTLAERAGR